MSGSARRRRRQHLQNKYGGVRDGNRKTGKEKDGLTKLTTLEMNNCRELETMDAGGCTALKGFSFGSNYKLKSLNVSGCSRLTALDCSDKKLETLNVANCPALAELYCDCNQLTRLDLTGCSALEKLECNNNQLENLDVSGCPDLKYLYCYECPLTSLDISKNKKLIKLDCNQTRMKTLNANGCRALKELDCSFSALESLNVNGCSSLQSLSCIHNKLTSLRISGSKFLRTLNCQANQLKKLDVSAVAPLNRLVKTTEPVDTYYLFSRQKIGGSITELEEVHIYEWENDTTSLVTDTGINVITTGEDVIDPPDLSNAAISAIKNQVYTGKAIEPGITVKYDGKKLKKGKDYTVKYKNNKKIGTATVIVKGMGKYTGENTATFDIIPVGVKPKSLKSYGSGFIAKWGKGKNITGYEIEYWTDETVSQSVFVDNPSETRHYICELPNHTTYYVRIRTYKKIGLDYYYSAWSAKKKILVSR